jgi:putative membrane protein insertion efficiency factor
MVTLRPLVRICGRLPALLVEALARGYQLALRPLLVGACKFHPTCSEYMIQAVREWGALRGGWLGLKRIVRCHPFGPGGIDLVPPNPTRPTHAAPESPPPDLRRESSGNSLSSAG